MTALTRFPSRIRFVNPDGTLTPEALRMLDALVTRAGGTLGDVGNDVFAAPATAYGAAGTAPDVTAPVDPAGYMAPVDLQPAGAGGFFDTTFQGGSR